MFIFPFNVNVICCDGFGFLVSSHSQLVTSEVLNPVHGRHYSLDRWSDHLRSSPYTADKKQTETNSVALGPRANYTEWASATCRRNLVSTFPDRGVSRGERGRSPIVVNLSFLDRSHYFLSSSSSFILTRVEWTPFQIHCYSENLGAPGIEPATSGLAARNCDH
jgi:hypothetical protein